MDAGYLPPDLDRFELWQVRHLLKPDQQQPAEDMAVVSYLARKQGKKLQPKPAELTDEMRAALAAKRAESG